MFDLFVLKFFDINTRNDKVLHPLLVKWKFSSLVRLTLILNTDGVVRGPPGLAACGGIFHGSMREFIGGFSAFLDI